MQKGLILIIFPVVLISKKCASHFCRETTSEINNFQKQKHGFKIHLDQLKLLCVVNWTCHSLNGDLLEITRTVPLIFKIVKSKLIKKSLKNKSADGRKYLLNNITKNSTLFWHDSKSLQDHLFLNFLQQLKYTLFLIVRFNLLICSCRRF